MFVELSRHQVLRIHNQSKRRHLFEGLQATVHRAGHKQFAKPLVLTVCTACQSAHAKAGHGITWKLFSVSLAQAGDIHLRGAQGVVAQDETGRCLAGQYKDGADAFAAMLGGKTVQVVVKLGHATGKPCAVMNVRVKRVFFQHGASHATD